MLKLAETQEEQDGNRLMVSWAGQGAAKVFESFGPALLMARAQGEMSLTEFSKTGKDDLAIRILCATAETLHAASPPHNPDLRTLEDWFAALWPFAQTRGGIWSASAHYANHLFNDPWHPIALHGDLHHGNVLDFGHVGWRAIDPKGIWGERGFDYANIFTNPDMADPAAAIAIDRSRFQERLNLVAMLSGIPPARLAAWVVAWCGLSAAWSYDDGNPAPICETVAGFALDCLKVN